MTSSRKQGLLVPFLLMLVLVLPIPLMPEQGWKFIEEHVPAFGKYVWLFAFFGAVMWLGRRIAKHFASQASSHPDNNDPVGCGTVLFGLIAIIGIIITYYILSLNT